MRKSFAVAVTSLLILALPAFGQSGDGGIHAVSKFLAADTLQELGSIIEPDAHIHNARATFTVNTASGPIKVTGTVSMLERVNELRAVETLEAMKKTDVYLDAVKNSAKAPIRYGEALVDEPVDTLKDTARGLGGFFADVGYSAVSKDPSQDNVAKTGLGQSNAQRAFAFQLGVNPYSQYQPLQDALSEVSWTAVGGGLTVGAAFRAVQNMPGQVLVVSRIANTGRELVRDNSPRELKNRNEESLRGMGVGAALTDAMINNFNFDPETETRLIVSLESMKGVKGRPNLVTRATLATSRSRAEEIRDWAELMASYHEKVSPAVELVPVTDAVFMIDKQGGAHGVFPTDYIVPAPNLTATLAGITDDVKAAGYTPNTIYVTGAMDPAAQKALLELGWKQVEQHAEAILRGS